MAKEITGDLFDYWRAGYWTGITTNGSVRKDGKAVMGRGVAKQAADMLNDLQKDVGKHLQEIGNETSYWGKYRLFIIPVKHQWHERADPSLIQLSLKQLYQIVSFAPGKFGHVYLPRPGCGNGQLDWEKDGIREMVHRILDDRFTIVEKYP